MNTIFTHEEIAAFRNDTTGCKHVNHLNNAGASLMPDKVSDSIIEHIRLESHMGGYEAAAIVKNDAQAFYTQAGKLLNCKASNIAFTVSATDAYIKALSSIPFEKGDVILTDNDDYISNQIQFLSCQKRFDLKIIRMKNAPEGGINLNDLEETLAKYQPRLLALTYIPTNSGLIQPVKEAAKIYEAYRQKHSDKTWYLLDACQAVGQLKLDVQELNCDFLSATSRKFLRGPRGSGFLYIADRALQQGLEPLFIDMRGADWIEKDLYKPRPDAMRYETWEFSHALLLATKEAIIYCLQIGEHKIEQQIKFLSARLRQQLSGIDKVRVLDKGAELGGLVTFTVKDGQPHHILDELRKRKINAIGSYRNVALIDYDEKKVDWAVRASPHYFNTLEEIDSFTGAIKEIIR